MSLYNMVHGFNPLAAMVLAMVGIEASAVPRFRDAYYDGEHLCIHTRTGGGNRPYYESPQSYRDETGEDSAGGCWNEDLRALPGFVRDEDDDYDSTYATFYFEVPERFAWFKDWASDKAAESPAERWQKAIDHIRTASMDDPIIKKLSAVLQPVADFLAAPPAKGER